MALRNVALEQSSLDKVINASINFLHYSRPRIDSLCQMRQGGNFGRKRAMTVDGPIKEKFVPLGHSEKSAFRSYKDASRNQEAVQETKEDDNEEEGPKEVDMKVASPKLNRKRTHAVMQKDFPPKSSQLLLSPSEDFSGRKRAKSF